MQVWTSTIQRLTVVVIVMSGIGLVGCRSTANRLSGLPGLGWMANSDQQPMIASREGSQLPPPSAVSAPYRREATVGSNSRNFDGSVASFAQRDRYPTTGYGSEATSRTSRPPAAGYQTGPYDVAPSNSRGDSRAGGGTERSRYYDQFAPGGGTNSSQNYSSEPAGRYSTSDGNSSYSSSWSSDGGNNRSSSLGQRLDERVAQAQSRYSEVTQSLDQRAAGAVQSLEQRAVNTTRDYANVASAEARNFQQRASDLAGGVQGRIDYAGRALDDVTNAATDALPSPRGVSVQQPTYGTGRHDSGPSHYDQVAVPSETPPVASARTSEPWRPGSTSDYNSRQLSAPIHLRDAADAGMGYRGSSYPDPIDNGR